MTTLMDLEGIMLSEINQTEEDKYLNVECKKKPNSQKQDTWLPKAGALEK